MPCILLTQESYSFVNLGINYTNWTKQTQDNILTKNFIFASTEYGFGSKLTEFYGNTNIENPFNSYDDEQAKNLRFLMVNDFDIKLTESFRIHLQDFHLQTDNYFVNDSVLGFSYKYIYQGFWFKPFIGVHYTYDSYFNGVNGLMTGWLLDYKFKILEQTFSIFEWNEIEFLRDKNFYELVDGTPIGDSKSNGLNGAIKFYWHPNEKITAGIEYRYSKYKRGSKEFLGALIYSVKCNF
ncbi:hypothetical protein JHD46_00545 [Sulfurimonas sp. SAG-AH-194-C20]|nr:outer membrane protein OmpK [Sulfurimonas sp. SAG-AH-194-C20]MDF1878120.1 hypothetical protein [Sulfurimonas sp. SAG-AH-194-C20]